MQTIVAIMCVPFNVFSDIVNAISGAYDDVSGRGFIHSAMHAIRLQSAAYQSHLFMIYSVFTSPTIAAVALISIAGL